jgi:hypothetical protein
MMFKVLLSSCLLFLPPLMAAVKTDRVLDRFHPPAGYLQSNAAPGSFAAWLGALPLKPEGTHTLTYRGDVARTDAYTAAVVDMSVGKEDLQQCADAVMRLRGEYLYHRKEYKAIAFNFTSGFHCDYVHYAEGYRYRNDRWVLKALKDYGYKTFMEYMDLVFAYAGTQSLQKELTPVTSANNLKAGDVFIKGGSPGHCLIVLDVAEDQRRRKLFLLAQSFMPAQNIQIVQAGGSPWFSLDKSANIPYGELISPAYLRRFAF